MHLLDHNGRVFGKVNLFDAFLVAVVAALTALAYQWLTADYRVAPPYALESRQVLAGVHLQLPPEHAWLCDDAAPGLEDVDPRSGETRARVLGCALEGGVATVHLEIHAVRDGAGRLLYRGALLVPGRTLRLEMESVLLEGVVRRVVREEHP